MQALLEIGYSFVGSLLAGVVLYVTWEHYHLSHLWADRQERIEQHRAKRNWDGLTEDEKRDKI
jgi:hypothetical protein